MGTVVTDASDQWVTYNEAASYLGIHPDSVKRKAQRGKWPRRVGPDRRTRFEAVHLNALREDIPVQPVQAAARQTAVGQMIKLRDLFWPNGQCAYCPGPANGLDHLMPRILGGTDDAWNMIPCCHSCNASKGTRAVERFASLRTLHRIRVFCEAARMLSEDVR